MGWQLVLNVLFRAAYKAANTTLSWEKLVLFAPLAIALLPLFMPWGRWFSSSIVLLPLMFFLFITFTILGGVDGPGGFAVAFYMITWFIIFLIGIAIRLVVIALSSAINKIMH
jgi:hypothetical protein